MSFIAHPHINPNTHDLLAALGFKKTPPDEICPAVEAWNGLRLLSLQPKVLASYFNILEYTAASIILRQQAIAEQELYIISLDLNLIALHQARYGKVIPSIVSENDFLQMAKLNMGYPIDMNKFQIDRFEFAKILAPKLERIDPQKMDRCSLASELPPPCYVPPPHTSKYGPT